MPVSGLRLIFSQPKAEVGSDQLLRGRPADGQPDQLRPGSRLELLLDVLAVRPHRLDAQVQALADLLGGQSLANQLEDLELAVAERTGGPLAGGGAMPGQTSSSAAETCLLT